tara:strand:+ start:23 stop:403 length:381 start_codon:yes stop_codon:yes gene_type:complete
MSTVIKLKSSEVAASVPSTSDLQVGEVALNIADGKFFTKTSSNVVKEVGGAGSVTLQSVTNIGASTTRDITLDGANLIFEGNVANAFETTLSAEEPTTDNTVLLPNASGTLATAGDALAFSIVFGG